MIMKRQVFPILVVFWILVIGGPLSSVHAACTSTDPAAGETVTCTGLNDSSVDVRNDGVIINILAGAELNNATTLTMPPLGIIIGTDTTINNAGLIQATGGNRSLIVLNGSVTIVNNGTIAISTGVFAAEALSVGGGVNFSLTNASTGIISATGVDTFAALRYQGSNTLQTLLLDNAGEISGDTAAVVLNLFPSSTAFNGTITNSGTITGSTQALGVDYLFGESLTFDNSGSISSGSDYGVEINGGGIANIQITNSGSISGDGGLLVQTSLVAATVVDLRFSNTASGNINTNGRSAGVSLQNSSAGTIDFSNDGAISATGNSSSALRIEGGPETTTTVDLSGSIQATGSFADGISTRGSRVTTINIASSGQVRTDGDSSEAVRISNSGSSIDHDINLNLDGLIEGLGASATGLVITESASGVWNVINTGTIRGDTAINLSNTLASVVLNNRGTIESTAGSTGLAVFIQTGGQVINSGSITGRVLIGDGGSFELLEGGTIDGTIASDTGIGSFLHSYGAIDSSLDGSQVRGFESFTKQGSGQLTLTGSLNTTGPTLSDVGAFELNEGSLHLTEAGSAPFTTLNANLTIADVAMLTGSGNIMGNLMAFGRISPGSSAGRFLIDGDLVLTTSSSLIIEFFGFDTNSDPIVDFLDITGTAEIAGNLTLEIPDDLSGNFSFVFLQAKGGVNGTFDDVTLRDNATATVEFSPNQIAVDLQASENTVEPTPDPVDPDPPPDPGGPQPDPVTPPVSSPPDFGSGNVSQVYVAAASDSSLDLMTAHQALMGARTGRTGVNSCGPSSFSASNPQGWQGNVLGSGFATGSACDGSNASNEVFSAFGAVIGFATAAASHRLDTEDLFAATQNLFAMNATQGSKTIAATDNWTAYMSGGYGSGKSKGSENQAEYDYDIVNLAAGIDHFVGDNITVGLGVGWGLVDGDYRGGGSHETESSTVSAYAAWVSPVGWYANGVFSYAETTFDQLRPTDPDDLSGGVLESDADGRAVALSGVFGRDITLGRNVIGVNLGLSYVDTRVDGYTESLPGDDEIQNTVGTQKRDSLRSSVGIRYGYFFQPRWGTLLPQLRAAWVHDFRDDAEAIGPDILFDPPDRDFFNVGASLIFVRSSGFVAGINYDAKVGSSDSEQQTASLSIRWRF